MCSQVLRREAGGWLWSFKNANFKTWQGTQAGHASPVLACHTENTQKWHLKMGWPMLGASDPIVVGCVLTVRRSYKQPQPRRFFPILRSDICNSQVFPGCRSPAALPEFPTIGISACASETWLVYAFGCRAAGTSCHPDCQFTALRRDRGKLTA